MLNIFTLVNGRLFQEEIDSLEELSKFQPIWVDLESPTLEEKRWVKQYFGLSIPEDAMDVLLKLFDADAEYSADTREGIYDELEKVRKQVRAGEVPDALAGEVLGAIARQEDLNGRIRRNVMDTRRALSFMMRSRMLNAGQFEEARQIVRDIESLDNHTAFLFDKINFLMDATVGFINISQNKIIKIFSVASVALLPPTLIASIYGMNFKAMPELEWSLGYPFAIGLMVASVAAPFIYFRRKGWLR